MVKLLKNYYGVTSFLMYCLYTAVAVILIVYYFHYVWGLNLTHLRQNGYITTP